MSLGIGASKVGKVLNWEDRREWEVESAEKFTKIVWLCKGMSKQQAAAVTWKIAHLKCFGQMSYALISCMQFNCGCVAKCDFLLTRFVPFHRAWALRKQRLDECLELQVCFWFAFLQHFHRLIKPNFCFDLSHRRTTTVSLETRNSFTERLHCLL